MVEWHANYSQVKKDTLRKYLTDSICRMQNLLVFLVACFGLSSTLSLQTGDEVHYMSRVLYSSAMRSLMYTMVCSRSYLSCPISRNMTNPNKEHWKAAW